LTRRVPGHLDLESASERKATVDTVGWPLIVTIPTDLKRLSELRSVVSQWLVLEGIAEEPRAAVVLATHEAVVNAVEHSDAGEPALVRGRTTASTVEIEVRDHGRWKQGLNDDEERGRGLLIIAGLMDEVEVISDEGGTTVRMCRRTA
jgi:anti-sigma regulatory factor (Ser/Thr protein kinase)